LITFTDVENNEYQAQCEIEKTDAVNGEKSLSGTIYFGQDVKANIAKGWTLSFLDEDYVVVTYTKNDKENTVTFSAVQAFFYKMSKTGVCERVAKLKTVRGRVVFSEDQFYNLALSLVNHL